MTCECCFRVNDENVNLIIKKNALVYYSNLLFCRFMQSNEKLKISSGDLVLFVTLLKMKDGFLHADGYKCIIAMR